MSAASMDSNDSSFELPRLRVSFNPENDTQFLNSEDNVPEFFDVKFCPFQPLNQDPVFAAVSKKHIVLCRLHQDVGDANPCEVIAVIRDDDAEASNCCCTWTKNPTTGSPLLCVGGLDAKVKIYDVISGRLYDTFVGHGGDVNDLITSPIDPYTIVSASDDTSVRLWSLLPEHSDQPCRCIFAGDVHSWSLLSVAFHQTGRFLLSAGHDQVINLWTVPTLPTSAVSSPLEVRYPHFSTSAVHGGIIDCVAFYGDYILSRACHDDVIVLWKIEGFSSEDDVELTPVPTNYGDTKSFTRSAFVPSITNECPSQYIRLLEFDTPKCGPQFFMRFNLFQAPDKNSVLAFCNAAGEALFWDFKRLEAYSEFMQDLGDDERDTSIPLPPPSWLKPVATRKRKKQLTQPKRIQATSVAAQVESGVYSSETLASWASRYNITDGHTPLKAHRVESSSTSVVGRQAAWSPGGEWCVVAGSLNTVLVFHRWAAKNFADEGSSRLSDR